MIRLLVTLLLLPGMAQAVCRQALSLGLDVSRSVDAAEYRLQLDGVAAALNADAVQEIFFLQPGAPIRIHVFEWSGPVNQTEIVPWTAIRTPADLASVTSTLANHDRTPAAPTTAIGSAILQGFAYLSTQSDCWKRTLDLSGDGETNTGPLPQNITEDQRPSGVTVNGLVIGAGDLRGDDERFSDIKQLSSYYRVNVIRGPGAFVEVALGYEDYAAAMERKLLRELSSLAIGQLITDKPRDVLE
ncbi:DUF1194 domain-containing protein [Yoonia litorea]|uniref:VWFA domain-containing protein n=1 Tax=Yoonia litorea TaxID=1123755 RepID=A0A1I6LKP5_9RHOB|nr:DUF1194 domain-containing protein [Yoonia litorea]SFS04019.1 Protein of unknown function [Yoonia litorea]